MKKRGQVTVFIVLGIVIIVFTGIYFYASSASAKIKSQSAIANSLTDSDSQIVTTYAESCIKVVAEEALFNKIGMQGGYINVGASIQSTEYFGNDVPYYLEADCLASPCDYTTNIPASNIISDELADYIIPEFENCFKTEVFSSRGLEIIKPSAKNADVSFNKEDTAIRLNYPLIIRKGKNEAKIESFSVTLPIRLKALHDSANELVVKIKDTGSNTYTITAGDCDLYYDKNDLTNVYIKPGDGGSKIVQFVDFSTYLEHYFNSYIFQFAVKNVDISGGCPV